MSVRHLSVVNSLLTQPHFSLSMSVRFDMGNIFFLSLG